MRFGKFFVSRRKFAKKTLFHCAERTAPVRMNHFRSAFGFECYTGRRLASLAFSAYFYREKWEGRHSCLPHATDEFSRKLHLVPATVEVQRPSLPKNFAFLALKIIPCFPWFKNPVHLMGRRDCRPSTSVFRFRSGAEFRAQRSGKSARERNSVRKR